MDTSGTISLIISIISLILSIGAFFFAFRKYRRDKPILAISPYISSYSTQLQEFPELNFLKINASFIVNNTGDIPTSITASSGLIGLMPNKSVFESLYKSNAIIGNVNVNNLPIEIKANCATTINLEYTFQFDIFEALDSCLRPVSIYIKPQINENPTRDDIILHVRFYFVTTHNQVLKTSACVYRNDQSESKNVDSQNTGLLQSSVNLARNRKKDLQVT
jgi:hypothetical protein